jgi:hypothetical protein
VNSCTAAIIRKGRHTMKKQIVIGDFGPSPVAFLFMRFLRPSYGTLSPGVTNEIQTFFAFVVGKGLRAQRLPVKVGK